MPLLQAGDFAALTELAGQESGVAAILMQFLYEPGALLYWRALEGLGLVAGSHPEQVRKLINRLLYLLNEDSGSNGWGAAAPGAAMTGAGTAGPACAATAPPARAGEKSATTAMTRIDRDSLAAGLTLPV